MVGVADDDGTTAVPGGGPTGANSGGADVRGAGVGTEVDGTTEVLLGGTVVVVVGDRVVVDGAVVTGGRFVSVTQVERVPLRAGSLQPRSSVVTSTVKKMSQPMMQIATSPMRLPASIVPSFMKLEPFCEVLRRNASRVNYNINHTKSPRS